MFIARLAAVLALLTLVGIHGIVVASPSSDPEQVLNLLPLPKSIEPAEGRFAITDDTRIFLPAKLDRPELLAVLKLRDVIASRGDRSVGLDRIGLGVGESASDAQDMINNAIESLGTEAGTTLLKSLVQQGLLREDDFLDAIANELGMERVQLNRIEITPELIEGSISLAVAGGDTATTESYVLVITPQTVKLTGSNPAGLFYGLQTLRQLVTQFGASLPAMTIRDEPDFKWRGFYLDASRGRVPTLETLKELVDELAYYKVNMLQIYIEHPFAFRFDPSIAQMKDPLTPTDMIELDAYCRDRHIDFVPSLQSFGHMGGALSLPQYQSFADIEVKPWEEMTWYDRMKGATIDISNPEALQLLEKMHDEFLPLFTSGFVNVCADETYALGEGKTKELAEKEGKATLYLCHINWLNDLAHRYGKQMMFWGDIVKKHPEAIPRIPKDAILLNWGYGRNADFDSCKLFKDAGLEFFVCPGTSGWNRILADVTNADLNIRRYAAAGKEYGAIGLLNTDWGDHGHYNMFSGSLYGMVLGAAMGWNTAGPDAADFDRAWSALVFGVEGDAPARSLRDQSSQTMDLNSWRAFYFPFLSKDFEKAMNADRATALIDAGKKGEALFRGYLNSGTGPAWVDRELVHASIMNQMLGEKYFLAQDLKAANEGGTKDPKLATRLGDWADRLDGLATEYRALWLARDRQSDLKRNEQVFTDMAAEAREAAKTLRP